MRLWKRKWFVLSDYCLFYYKGESVKSALDQDLTDMNYSFLIVKSDKLLIRFLTDDTL